MFLSGGKTATFSGKFCILTQNILFFTPLTTSDQLKPLDDSDVYLRNVSESITWLLYSLPSKKLDFVWQF